MPIQRDPQATAERPRATALALAGGGARAAYQVGAIAGIAAKVGDSAVFPIITGVSAGAINAAYLAATGDSLQRAVDGLAHAWLRLSNDRVFRSGVVPLISSAAKTVAILGAGGALRGRQGLLDTAPLRRTLAGYVSPEAIESNVAAGRLRALAITTTNYATGRTVTFVHGRDELPTWTRAGRLAVAARIGVDHVMASSALPLVFPAIKLGTTYFGDGSIRQTAPLAPAVHLGADCLIAIALRHQPAGSGPSIGTINTYPSAARILGTLLNSVFLDAVDSDAERLQRINRTLAGASSPHSEGLRPVTLAVLRPSRDLGELAKDLAHRLPTGIQFLLRGLGAAKSPSPDLLSYLLFDRIYAERLIELGRNDAVNQWPTLEPLFEKALS